MVGESEVGVGVNKLMPRRSTSSRDGNLGKVKRKYLSDFEGDMMKFD
jgi:hypothetical protein